MARNHLLTSLWHNRAVTNLRHASSPNRLLRQLGARNRRLPDFIIAGAQKAGTTSLWAYLCEHPGVEPPITKEVAFFDRDYDRGINWYRLHFPRVRAIASRAAPSPETLTGEATPNYIFHAYAPGRIAQALPDARIIFLLRNPVDRAFSHYQHKQRRRRETRRFEEAIEAEIERLDRDAEECNERDTYVARGLYVDQIRRWQRVFADEQLLILESGEFFRRTSAVFQRVCDFLGLPQWQPPAFGNRYPGRYGAKMAAATRRKLVDYFAPHNERLYRHLGTAFDWDR